MASLKDEADYAEALKLKNTGNEAFKAGDYKEALKYYSRIFIHIGMNPHMDMAAMMGGGGKPPPQAQQPKKEIDPHTAKVNALRLTAFNNMATVYLKTKQWPKCREKCDKVIERDAKNTKALFRRGTALRHLNCFELARADFASATKILEVSKDAKDIKAMTAIKREMKILAKEEKKAENAFYKQMKKQMKRGQKKQKKKNKKTEKKADS